MDHLINNQGGPLPCFDSSEVIRGYRVIKCEDAFSKEFLSGCVHKIRDAWDGLRLKLILAREIPRRPRIRIWLPNMAIDSDKLITCLKLHNPAVPMDDWKVIKAEEPHNNTLSFLLLITEDSAVSIEKIGCKLRFGIRHAKVKIFRSAGLIDDLDEVDDANKLLEDMRIETTQSTAQITQTTETTNAESHTD